MLPRKNVSCRSTTRTMLTLLNLVQVDINGFVKVLVVAQPHPRFDGIL